MRNGIKYSLFALGLSMSAASAQAQDPEAGEVGVSESASVDTSSASASSGGSRGPLRVYGGLHLGGGGNIRVKFDADDFPGDIPSDKSDMGFLIGFQLGADYVLHQYFALGGEFRLTSTALGDLPDEVDRSDAAIMLYDFNVKPRGRYEFANLPLEVYGTMPLGLGIVSPKAEGADTKAGFNLGIGAGASYFFNDHMGVNTEMIGMWHWIRESEEDSGVEITAKTRIGQFYWLTNFVYVL